MNIHNKQIFWWLQTRRFQGFSTGREEVVAHPGWLWKESSSSLSQWSASSLLAFANSRMDWFSETPGDRSPIKMIKTYLIMFGGMNIYVSAALGFDFGPETLNNRWGAPKWQPVSKLAHVWGGSSIPFATCSLDTLQSTSIHWVLMTWLTCSLAASTLGSGMIPWPSRRLVAFYLAAPINRRWPLNDNTGLGRWHSMNSQKIFRTTVYTRKTSKLCSEIWSCWWNTRTTCCDWFRAGSDFLQHQAEGLQQRASYVLAHGCWSWRTASTHQGFTHASETGMPLALMNKIMAKRLGKCWTFDSLSRTKSKRLATFVCTLWTFQQLIFRDLWRQTVLRGRANFDPPKNCQTHSLLEDSSHALWFFQCFWGMTTSPDLLKTSKNQTLAGYQINKPPSLAQFTTPHRWIGWPKRCEMPTSQPGDPSPRVGLDLAFHGG